MQARDVENYIVLVTPDTIYVIDTVDLAIVESVYLYDLKPYEPYGR